MLGKRNSTTFLANKMKKTVPFVLSMIVFIAWLNHNWSRQGSYHELVQVAEVSSSSLSKVRLEDGFNDSRQEYSVDKPGLQLSAVSPSSVKETTPVKPATYSSKNYVPRDDRERKMWEGFTHNFLDKDWDELDQRIESSVADMMLESNNGNPVEEYDSMDPEVLNGIRESFTLIEAASMHAERLVFEF